MRTVFHATAALLALTATTGCERQPAGSKPDLPLHEVMAGTIDPVADVIWETSSKSYGDDGLAKTGVLVDADWAKIASAGRDLHDGAMVIAGNPEIAVVQPGQKILDEGTVPEAITAAQVTGYVDHDRPGLVRHARELSGIALAIEAAAKARDAHRAVQLSEDLDGVCESCHQQFWYPQQKAPIDYRAKTTLKAK